VKYVHTSVGTNSRLDTMQAAILRVKLRQLDRWNAARAEHAAAYHELLAGVPCVAPQIAPKRTHIFHLYVVQVEQRDEVQKILGSRGIGTGIHYPIPIHVQEACADLGYRAGSFPATERAASRILSLPMYAEMTGEQRKYVVESLVEAIESSTKLSPSAARQ